MSEVLSRLFPAIRDVRTPLIVGAVWFAVLGLALGLVSRTSITAPGSSSDPVVELLHDLLSPLPGWAVVAAIALSATIVGSGMVRLMDRMRQAFRYPQQLVVNDEEYSDEFRRLMTELMGSSPAPIDKLLRDAGHRVHRKKCGTRDSPLDRDRRYLVADHVLGQPKHDPARREWGGPEDAPAVFRDDLRLFLFHLARDERFDGYNDQQLLRFSLIPPLGSAVILSVIWLLDGVTLSKILLIALLAGFIGVLYVDRFRLRSLLIERWEELADEYPTWLPDAALDRRNLGRERVREILHGEAGIRSVTAHQEVLRQRRLDAAANRLPSSDPDGVIDASNEKRLRVLRATSTQVRLSGAPALASALDLIISDDEEIHEHFDDFYRLAARWSGSRIEYCSDDGPSYAEVLGEGASEPAGTP